MSWSSSPTCSLEVLFSLGKSMYAASSLLTFFSNELVIISDSYFFLRNISNWCGHWFSDCLWMYVPECSVSGRVFLRVLSCPLCFAVSATLTWRTSCSKTSQRKEGENDGFFFSYFSCCLIWNHPFSSWNEGPRLCNTRGESYCIVKSTSASRYHYLLCPAEGSQIPCANQVGFQFNADNLNLIFISLWL